MSKKGYLIAEPVMPDPIPGFDDFGHLKCKGMVNVRDLGGLPAANGKVVKQGVLLRGDALHRASDDDAVLLTRDHDMMRIVDFRTDIEIKDKPDLVDKMPGVSYHALPVLKEESVGITHGGGASGDLKTLLQFADNPFEQIVHLYATMVTSEAGIAAYREFFSILLEADDGATFWHCTEGKDRTGLAAMFVEYALGVSEEHIRADYLATNMFVRTKAEETADWLARHDIAQLIGMGLDSFFYAHAEYLESAMGAIHGQYGSITRYLDEALGVGSSEIAVLRDKYLESC